MKMFDGKDKDMCKVELLNERVDANGIYTSGGISITDKRYTNTNPLLALKVTVLPHHPNTLSVTHTTFEKMVIQ